MKSLRQWLNENGQSWVETRQKVLDKLRSERPDTANDDVVHDALVDDIDRHLKEIGQKYANHHTAARYAKKLISFREQLLRANEDGGGE